nr:perlucin-like protein [Crassostrea gigas]
MKTMNGEKNYFGLFFVILAILQTASGHNCYHGWAPYKSHCYYLSTTEVTLKEALEACYNMRADLLEVKDRMEERWLELQFKIRGYVHGVWLGYSDLLQENQFLTISNAEPLNYKHWNSGEPSNTNGREHCVGYSMGTKNWNDCYCTGKLNYVCKK